MTRTRSTLVPACAGLILLGGCGGGEPGGSGAPGSIEVDGSSTVFPVTEAVAEEFIAETGGEIRVTVAMSGTGGGFRRFCAGEIPITNASRPIEESELEMCRAAGIEPVELEVAWDGLAVVVHPSNDFVECLTVDELRRIWEPGSTVQAWSQVRPGWPAEPIELYGPGTNSGTFDYFTEVVVGEADASRADYTASEDDNVLVQGVSGDPYSLGYFGYAYVAENEGRVRAVPVDAGSGCVQPTPRTIETGEYAPLSRPLLVYVARSALQEPAVREFVAYYLRVAPELSEQVGYVPLAPERYEQQRRALAQAADGGA